MVGFVISPNGVVLSGGDNGWSPSASDVVVNVPGYRSTVDWAVVYTVELDISETRGDPVAAEAA